MPIINKVVKKQIKITSLSNKDALDTVQLDAMLFTPFLIIILYKWKYKLLYNCIPHDTQIEKDELLRNHKCTYIVSIVDNRTRFIFYRQ